MRRLVILAVVLVNSTGFAAGLISNGSFEANGAISDIKAKSPQGWQLTMPSKFEGSVVANWHTDGNYSLMLYTNSYQYFVKDQNAVVWQNIDFTNVGNIYFDLNLYSNDGIFDDAWDGSKVTAFVKIDSNDVWTSAIGADGIDDVNVVIGNCSGVHKVSLGIRIKSSGTLNSYYISQWDSLAFNVPCGGFGALDSDFNRDCYVDFKDLYELADNWLRTDLTSNDCYINLYYDGTINLLDFAVLADQWMICTDSQFDNCVQACLKGDLNQDGIVNFVDYSILMNEPDADYNDVKAISEQWLERSWLFKN
ncbi:MAG: hypothetical protein ABFD79_08300 [Phycisphaerales bacterium]